MSLETLTVGEGDLATVCRFVLDLPALNAIGYTPESWGGKGQMTEHGNPCMVGDPPIKFVTELEGIETPDPGKDGL